MCFYSSSLHPPPAAFAKSVFKVVIWVSLSLLCRYFSSALSSNNHNPRVTRWTISKYKDFNLPGDSSFRSKTHIWSLNSSSRSISIVLGVIGSSRCDCERLFISRCQPCNRLATCPGCTPPLAPWQLGCAPALQRPLRGQAVKMMNGCWEYMVISN